MEKLLVAYYLLLLLLFIIFSTEIQCNVTLRKVVGMCERVKVNWTLTRFCVEKIVKNITRLPCAPAYNNFSRKPLPYPIRLTTTSCSRLNVVGVKFD